MSAFKPKTKILFPNRWAADSFMLKLKRSSGWTFLSANGGIEVKIKPSAAPEYILIGLLKSGAGMEVAINAEKIAHNQERIWAKIFEYARLYRS